MKSLNYMTFLEDPDLYAAKMSYILKNIDNLYDIYSFYLSRTKRTTFTFPSISVAAILKPHFFV